MHTAAKNTTDVGGFGTGWPGTIPTSNTTSFSYPKDLRFSSITELEAGVPILSPPAIHLGLSSRDYVSDERNCASCDGCGDSQHWGRPLCMMNEGGKTA